MNGITKLFKEISLGYVELDIPIKFDGFELIGYFPYHTASIRESELPSVSRKLFKELEDKLLENYISDNKAVYIFKQNDLIGCNGDFALKLHDFTATIGKWSHVIKY